MREGGVNRFLSWLVKIGTGRVKITYFVCWNEFRCFFVFPASLCV